MLVHELFEDSESGVETLYSGPEGWIKIPKTHAAMVKLGKGSKWSLSLKGEDRYFKMYHNKGSIYIAYDKDTRQMFAIHPDTGSVYDKDDRQVKFADLPVWLRTKVGAHKGASWREIPESIEDLLETVNPHFGLEDSGNARKARAAMKDVDIHFTSDNNFGITYFYFKTKKEMARAIKLVNGEIDKSKESEWGVNESIEELLEKKWIKTDPAKRGMFSGKGLAELEAQLARIKKSGPHAKGSPELKKEHELAFAIRMKRGHGKP